MAIKFNPLTGNFDFTGSGGGGGGSSYIDGEVQNFSALPETLGTPAVDSAYLVREAEGTWLLNRKPAGIYIRTDDTGVRANDWTHAGAFPDVFNDANFLLYDNDDSSKNLAFQLSGITTGTTRTLTVPDASGTIARTETFAAPPAIGNTTPAAGTFTTLNANNGTLTASAPVLDLAQTWNNAATTFTGLRFNATNTASAAASLVADFQVGGSSTFSVARGTTSLGRITIRCPGGDASDYSEITQSPGELNFRNFRNGNITFGLSGVEYAVTSFRARVRQSLGDSSFGWQGLYLCSSSSATGDVVLLHDGSDALALRRSTNAQTFNIYNTFTSSTNHERGFLRWSSNVFQIGTEKGSGGGTARDLAFQTDGVTRMTLNTAGQLGIGVTTPNRPLHIQAADAMGRIDRTGANGPAFLMIRMATLGTVTSSWLFGPATGFASVANDDFSIIDFGTNTSGVSGTQRLTIAKSDGQLTVNGNLNLSTKDLVTDTTTGTKIGTATTQKIGFFNATPVDQPATVTDPTGVTTDEDVEARTAINAIIDRLQELGLIA
jgi:hypothetical protein